MITYNNQVRLTSVERQQLCALTGEDASGIKTMNDLVNYIHAHHRTVDQRFCGPSACFARRMLSSFLPADCA